MSSLISSIKSNLTITIGSYVSGPFPTEASWVNPGPELVYIHWKEPSLRCHIGLQPAAGQR